MGSGRLAQRPRSRCFPSANCCIPPKRPFAPKKQPHVTLLKCHIAFHSPVPPDVLPHLPARNSPTATIIYLPSDTITSTALAKPRSEVGVSSASAAAVTSLTCHLLAPNYSCQSFSGQNTSGWSGERFARRRRGSPHQFRRSLE